MSLLESLLNATAPEDSVKDNENDTFPTTQKEDEVKQELLQVELSEYVDIIPKESKHSDDSNQKHMKRKRDEEEDDEDTKDILTGIYLRTMYPLSKAMDKTVTAGVFQSLNFQPAVLLNHCTKSSIMFSIEVWDNFTKYCNIIHTFLENNLTGKKTSIILHDSDIEVDNIRLRGCQLVRFRNLSKHHKKIILSHDEFYVLSNLVPAITRYLHQLVTYENLVSDYLKAAVLKTPSPQLVYGSIDASIYNKLPHEVDGYRRINKLLSSNQSRKTNVFGETPTIAESEKGEPKESQNEESSQNTRA